MQDLLDQDPPVLHYSMSPVLQGVQEITRPFQAGFDVIEVALARSGLSGGVGRGTPAAACASSATALPALPLRRQRTRRALVAQREEPRKLPGRGRFEELPRSRIAVVEQTRRAADDDLEGNGRARALLRVLTDVVVDADV